ncbi:hypothetical protein J8M21_19070 [Pseudoalteromonas luteoviolacea]|uniref:phage head morphogenesis protein n=1 Tax=Pseudoalteromonas luteoviolacea TaxID=43657 RepID=UPI001B3A5CF1|nr:hypothetical protein [Pseudoalteromonas luteoviolacea]MBQ4879318.1 hypothetical protein [Pseudoalteromonas luteoviolacea]MBQ4908378.1 hypothetical protein [Pseudoalteromonas luteoviolacea]
MESLRREPVDETIAEGMSLKAFQSLFIDIAQTFGWDYKGRPGWRSHVNYKTNLRQSYNAGRYQQLQAVKETRPYWMYLHDNSETLRELHLSWHQKGLSIGKAPDDGTYDWLDKKRAKYTKCQWKLILALITN